MATNKNASIRYRVLKKCFRHFRHRYYIEGIIDKYEEKLKLFNFKVNPRTNIFFNHRITKLDVVNDISFKPNLT